MATMEETVPVSEPEKYYLDSLTKIIGLFILSLAGCIGLFIIYILLNDIRNPKALYFKTTEAEQLVQDVPLDKPNMPINVLLNWVTQSMMTAHSFNFVNQPVILENARQYFTRDGYESFINALRDNKILEVVTNNKWVMNAVPDTTPQITKEGVLANYFLWKIKIPMTFRYRSLTNDTFDNVQITLLIVRVPSFDAPYGVRILKYEINLLQQGETGLNQPLL